MNRLCMGICFVLAIGFGLRPEPASAADDPPALRLTWARNFLIVSGPKLPGGEVRIQYLEAFCRAGSSDRDWKETVIPHTTRLVKAEADGHRLVLESTLADGVTVNHIIVAGPDTVSFQLSAHNPTEKPSAAVWAQPCVRVDRFTGVEPKRDSDEYLSRCFLFFGGRANRLPVDPWTTRARYVPGQVWCPAGIDRNDVNPRPLSTLVPSNGLIGCISADDSMILATAWEPYQELFQGVLVCIHSDFRIGGLAPGQTKAIRGKLYLVKNDMDALVRRYQADFPEHRSPAR